MIGWARRVPGDARGPRDPGPREFVDKRLAQNPHTHTIASLGLREQFQKQPHKENNRQSAPGRAGRVMTARPAPRPPQRAPSRPRQRRRPRRLAAAAGPAEPRVLPRKPLAATAAGASTECGPVRPARLDVPAVVPAAAVPSAVAAACIGCGATLCRVGMMARVPVLCALHLM